ncbi:uncharacterized protein LOC108907404 [Anoplophora glabripennis]|uniref:uncharacterized protein LOC108907404 n=1 Tax=Anoplophora glabripennis TaxID=217634 RepID=UPI000875851E|nr:uncharacterized protein LOC108907404 [Anoplophora glabripennis]
MQSKFYGLTPLDVRCVAYGLADRVKIKHPFNNTKIVAGEDWLSGFLKRNPQLSIRKPEATSLNRAAGFNKDQVSTFFSLLKAASEQYNFSAERIYNFDETGISTVPKPTKILAKRGQKQVGRIVSGERRSNITMACAFSVTGHYIPPLYLFPRKRLAPSLLRDAPPGAIGFANGSGWMDSEHFLKYLDHFIKHAKPSKEKPVLLILDGHTSHKQLEGVLKARENHIVMVTIPPHCSHRIQPLDLTFFGPFKNQYARECDYYMINHKGEMITIHDVVSLSGKAFQKGATIDKATKSSKEVGYIHITQMFSKKVIFCPRLFTEMIIVQQIRGTSLRHNQSLHPSLHKRDSCQLLTQKIVAPVKARRKTIAYAFFVTVVSKTADQGKDGYDAKSVSNGLTKLVREQMKTTMCLYVNYANNFLLVL